MNVENLINDAAQTTLNGTITAGATSLNVIAVAGSPTQTPFRLWIDNEIIIVLAQSSASVYTSIIRGVEGSVAAAHTNGAKVFYPRTSGVDVEQAVEIRRRSILGVDAPTAHAASHQNGGSDEISVTGLSGLLADPQNPTAHKTSHQDGGSDEISVTGLSGLLADAQTPLAHKTSHQDGGSDEISVTGLSGLLADAQTPLAHKTSHQSGGSDAIKLDDLAAPDNNTDLNVSTSAHGLTPVLPNDATKYLDGTGNYTVPIGNASIATQPFRLTLSSGNPVYRPVSATPNSTDTTAETVTFAADHGWTDGTICTPSATSGGLTAGVIYYLHIASSTSVSFHTTVADAIAGTSKVNLTASITAKILVSGVSNTTLYFSPVAGRGKTIALYNGSNWATLTSAEVSIALGTLTSSLPYDVFAYDSGGTLTLELLAWTSDSVRATALAPQDGIYVKTGSTTKRYVGTIRTNSTTTTIDDYGGLSGQLGGKRFVWNMDNRFDLHMAVTENSATWTYTGTGWRAANNNSNNKVEYVAGLPDEAVEAMVVASAAKTNSAEIAVGVGLDSTTTVEGFLFGSSMIGGQFGQIQANVALWPTLGYHALQWNEWSNLSSVTFHNLNSGRNCGLLAKIRG